MQNLTSRSCKNGHQFYKTSDCPTCPICEKENRPQNGFLSLLAAPARRALEHANIRTLLELSEYSEKNLLRLHGIGKSSIPILKKELEKEGLALKP
jgi:hypothetical protein